MANDCNMDVDGCHFAGFWILEHFVKRFISTAFPKTPPLMTSPKNSKQKSWLLIGFKTRLHKQVLPCACQNLPYNFPGDDHISPPLKKIIDSVQCRRFLGNMLTTPWRFLSGVSLNGGTPNLHPKMIIFSRKTPWVCWGNPPFWETPNFLR